MPVKNISLVDQGTGRKTEAADTELFSFEPADSWELVSRTEENGSVEYLYGYKEKLAPGESTDALFTEVELVYYLEGEIDPDEDLNMPIEALAIQAGLSDEGSLAAIYQAYVTQTTD